MLEKAAPPIAREAALRVALAAWAKRMPRVKLVVPPCGVSSASGASSLGAAGCRGRLPPGRVDQRSS